jgi:hypothetical protein
VPVKAHRLHLREKLLPFDLLLGPLAEEDHATSVRQPSLKVVLANKSIST